jgi:hypothetical protein
MWMENQIFGGELQPDATFSEIFAARVVIPRSEFARLGLGEHESPRRLSACFQWCHANLGRGGSRWSVMLRHDNAALIYFARIPDAVAFFARWAADAIPEQPAALAAQTQTAQSGNLRNSAAG